MVEGCLPAARPLQEVVDDVLLLPVPEISVVGLNLERSAEERGARKFARGPRTLAKVQFVAARIGLALLVLLVLLLPLQCCLARVPQSLLTCGPNYPARPLGFRLGGAGCVGRVRQHLAGGDVVCVLGILTYGGLLLACRRPGAPPAEAARYGARVSRLPAAARRAGALRVRSRARRLSRIPFARLKLA